MQINSIIRCIRCEHYSIMLQHLPVVYVFKVFLSHHSLWNKERFYIVSNGDLLVQKMVWKQSHKLIYLSNLMSFSCSLDSGALKAYGHRKPVQSRQSMETSVTTTGVVRNDGTRVLICARNLVGGIWFWTEIQRSKLVWN
jgi:hypothetical protein